MNPCAFSHFLYPQMILNELFKQFPLNTAEKITDLGGLMQLKQ